MIAGQENRFGRLLGAEPLQFIEHLPRALAKGRGEFLPSVAIKNHRAGTGDERAQRGNLADPRNFVTKVEIGQDANGLVHDGGFERCRTASNRQTPVATETLRLLTLPAIGIDTR